MKSGLLGRKLGHSYSPQIHALLGNADYCLLEKEPEEVGPFLQQGDFTGINVTIPYKKTVLPYLAELSPLAQRMGAVNTIVRRPDGSLYGHNTDYFGFSDLIRHSGIRVAGKKTLVLGSGGASNTAVKVLEDLGTDVVIISRQGPNHYGNLHLHADASVIVNATPVGMYPNTGVSPLNLSDFPHLEGVLDMIYNPARTQLLLDAQALGLPNENGLWMLVAQAKEAAEYFTGEPLPDSVIATVHQKLSARMQNVVLIGMPGCGKTTVGQALARECNRVFVDADEEIVKAAGKSIPEIFSQDGEAAFRSLETAVLSQLGKRSGLVLATGGGCVTRPENHPLLHQNGQVFWLRRELSSLPTEGRPLSQSHSLESLYTARKPLYEAFCDHSVENNGPLSQTVSAIVNIMEEPL